MTVPGGRPGTVRATAPITLGVEEEFVLLEPVHRRRPAVLAGPELVRMLGGEPGVRQELMRFQVETGTRVCTSLDEVGRELIRLRRLAADAAARLGCRLVASGVAPYRTPGLAAVTGQPRYQELARRYGPVVADSAPAACHVHVAVPSRDLGVQVLARIPGPGSAAARRHRQLPHRRRARYRMGQLAVRDPVPLADRGAARGMAGRCRLRHGSPPGPHRARRGAGRAERLLPRPGCPRATHRRGPGRRRLPRHRHRGPGGGADPGPGRHRPGRGPPRDAGGGAARPAGRRGLAAAARHGLARAGANPVAGQAADALALRARLLDHVYPALSDHGDTETVTRLLRRLDDRGTEPTASGPCSPRRTHARVHHRAGLRDASSER